MNAKMNETQLGFCDICAKTINNKSNSKHIISRTHKHKQKYGIINKENEFIKPDFNVVFYILDDIIKDPRSKNFLSIEFRCVYDIKITNIRNNKAIILTILVRYMEFKSQIFISRGKNRNARNNGFINDQIVKLTIKIISSLSNINIYYYVKLPIAIMHRQFFRKISQKQEDVNTFCYDLKNPSQFACRRCMINP